MKKIFKTLVRNKKHNKQFGGRDYIIGRISGMMSVFCEGCERRGFANVTNFHGEVLTTECTPEQYVQFVKTVDKFYPGLCIFDYKC